MKPWEKYKKLQEEAEKQVPPQEEETGPWTQYTKNFQQQRELESTMPETLKETGKDLAILGAQGATLDFGDEIAGGVEALKGGNYQEGRDAAREIIEGARERNPILGPIAEGAGSVALSAAVPIARGGTVLKELGLSAVQGAGNAPEMEDIPESVVTSGVTSLATQGTVGLAKKALQPATDILATTMGARGINFRKGEPVIDGEDLEENISKRLKDPAGLAARLDSLGFFGMGNRNLDLNTGKYVRQGGLEDAIQPVDMETMMGRVQQGVSILRDRNKQLISNKKIPVAKLGDALTDFAFDFIPSGENVAKRSSSVTDLVETAVNDLRSRGVIKGNYIDAKDVEKVKQYLQKTVADTYDGNKALPEITNVGVEARRKLATRIDELVDSYGGPEYAANNDKIRDLLTAQTMIHEKTSRQRGYTGSGPRLTTGGWKSAFSSALENTIFHPQADIARARMGQGLSTPAGGMVERLVERAPVEAVSNMTQDQQVQVPYRRPQSVPNIPEELIRTPLPRTTQGLIQNKNFVLAKVAQMAPQMFEAVQDLYQHDPESIQEIAPFLIKQMPHLFQKDKYNRFDGRILDEGGKSKAIQDTLRNSSLNSIQQAEIISRLNKEGLYDG